jgi:hypothetical protein
VNRFGMASERTPPEQTTILAPNKLRSMRGEQSSVREHLDPQ